MRNDGKSVIIVIVAGVIRFSPSGDIGVFQVSSSLSLSKAVPEGGGDPFRRGRGAVIDSRALPSLPPLLPDKTASGEARVGDRELLYGVHVRFCLSPPPPFYHRLFSPSISSQFPCASFLLSPLIPSFVGRRQLLYFVRDRRKEKGKQRLRCSFPSLPG